MSTTEFNEFLSGSAVNLKRFAYSLTRDNEAAKDLFQETLCKALVNRDKCVDGSSVKSWMYTIMRNIFINDYRRTVRSKKIFCNTTDPATNPAYAATATGFVNSVELKYLQASVYRLPEIFRFPFQLHCEGYRYNEIAGMLKEPLGTIKSRIHVARKILQDQVSPGKVNMN